MATLLQAMPWTVAAPREMQMIELTPQIISLGLLSGAIVGLFLGTFGGGGSVLAAPLLIYLVGVDDPHVAIGTSAAGVAVIALFSLIGHWRGGRVKWPCASVFALSGLAGSWVGSSLAKATPGDLLLLGFFACYGCDRSLDVPKAEDDLVIPT